MPPVPPMILSNGPSLVTAKPEGGTRYTSGTIELSYIDGLHTIGVKFDGMPLVLIPAKNRREIAAWLQSIPDTAIDRIYAMQQTAGNGA